MSGAEFIAVAAVASSIIAIVDGINKVVEAASDAEGLPKVFRLAAPKLEIISEILDTTKSTLDVHKAGRVDSAIQKTIENCQRNWQKLQLLFEKVIPDDQATRLERYRKAAKTLGKGGKVETLMKDLMESVQLLATFKILTETGEETTTKTNKGLEKHIADVSSWEPSLPDHIFEEGSYTMNVSGSGHSFVQGEGSTQNNLRDNSRQIFGVKGNYVEHAAFISTRSSEINVACLRSLNCPDPLAVKNNLKATKDKLIAGSMNWIFDNQEYKSWKNGKEKCLLWIKGGAGKGKTMMSIGLIEELSRSADATVAYFFCQDANYELNTVEAIIKGLIRSLAKQQEEVIKVLDQHWDAKNERFYNDALSWRMLWDILLEILDRLKLKCPHIYMIVDALDECQDGDMVKLLQILVRTGLDHPSKIKWLLTSRPLDAAQQELLCGLEQSLVSLELNSHHISKGVATYIDHKVVELGNRKGYGTELRSKIKDQLMKKAGNIYMWVSLVCDSLELVSPEHALATIENIPKGLHPFYNRALTQLGSGDPAVVEGCMRLLSTMVLARRSPFIAELESITGLDLSGEKVTLLLDRCSSFLKLQQYYTDKFANLQPRATIEFIHQSARDYLASKDGRAIFEANGNYGHMEIVQNSVSYLAQNLKFNILNLKSYSSRSESRYLGYPPRMWGHPLSLLTSIGYAATFWPHHLAKSMAEGKLLEEVSATEETDLGTFFQTKLLQWLECVFVLQRFSEVSDGLSSLINLMPAHYRSKYQKHPITEKHFTLPIFAILAQGLLHKYDGHPVPHSNCRLPPSAIVSTIYPLQVYVFVMAFYPEKDIIRRRCFNDTPMWLSNLLLIGQEPEAGSQTCKDSPSAGSRQFEPLLRKRMPYHPNCRMATVTSLCQVFAISHDNKKIALGCQEIDLWDATTGELERTFFCKTAAYTPVVSTLIFSPNGEQIISSFSDGTIRIWSAKTGELQGEFADSVELEASTIALSPNGKYIAAGYHSGDIKLWDISSRKLHLVLQCTPEPFMKIFSLVFSSNDGRVAIGTGSGLIYLWDISNLLPSKAKSLRVFNPSPVFKGWPHQMEFAANITFLRFSEGDTCLITNIGRVRINQENFIRVNQNLLDLIITALFEDLLPCVNNMHLYMHLSLMHLEYTRRDIPGSFLRRLDWTVCIMLISRPFVGFMLWATKYTCDSEMPLGILVIFDILTISFWFVFMLLLELLLVPPHRIQLDTPFSWPQTTPEKMNTPTIGFRKKCCEYWLCYGPHELMRFEGETEMYNLTILNITSNQVVLSHQNIDGEKEHRILSIDPERLLSPLNNCKLVQENESANRTYIYLECLYLGILIAIHILIPKAPDIF